MTTNPDDYELITLRNQLAKLTRDLQNLHDWRFAMVDRFVVDVLDQMIKEGCR